MRKVCRPGSVGLPAHLHDLHLAHHGVALHALAQPDQPVGHREHRVGVGLGEVLADQEGRGLPARHQHAELLHELLQVVVRVALGLAREHHGTEGVDEDERRTVRFDLGDDAAQHLVEVARQGVVRQVDEANRAVDRLAVEEIELLLVAQHLQRRLAQHREVQRGALRRRQREHHLVRQRRLAAAGRARDEVERELRQSAAEHLVQARHAGGQAVDRHFGGHGEVSCAGGPLEESCPHGAKQSLGERGSDQAGQQLVERLQKGAAPGGGVGAALLREQRASVPRDP